MSEKIGLEAVLQLNSFSQAVRTYNQAISGMSKNTASTASSISSSFVNLGSGILKVGAIAGGVGLAGIAALTGGLLLLGSTALTEFAKYERMALSIQSLVARELSQGQLVEQQRTVAISLTKKEAQELEGLAGKIHKEELARNTLHARIKEQSEALRQLREAHGNEALDVQTATARLAELENQYNESGAEIQTYKDRQVELTNKTGDYVTVIDKVRTGQMSMNEAMAQASPRAEELLKWIQLLAINSPFDQEGVANAFRTALAYGFTTEEAQRLTEAELDFVAATGQSIAVADGIALALGQMRARGKVSAEELNQLSERGLGVNQVLETMGFGLKDVEKGLVPVDALIEALIKDMEIFEGAGQKQSTTFAGLIASLSDLKSIGLREFFTGTFTAIQPYLADFVGMLTSAALETGSIRELGDALGVYVAGGIQQIVQFATQMQEIFGAFQTGGIGGLVAALGITPDAVSLIEKFQGMITDIANAVSGPLLSAFSGLSEGGLLDSFNQAISFVNEHFEEFKGALMGIGAVLAGGVFAALVAGILSLLTPINLIIAGAALLGAAWMGNWFGIRDTLTEAWATIQPILVNLWEWLKTNVPAAIQTLSDIWNNTLLPGFTRIYEVVSTEVLPAFQELMNTFTDATGGTQGLSDLWNSTLLPAIKAVGDFLVNTLFPAWVELEVFLAGALATAITTLADYWQNYLFPAMGKVKDAAVAMGELWSNTLEPAIVSVGDYLNVTLVPLLESIGNLFNAVINKALEASAGLWKNVLFPAITKVGNFLKDTLSPTFEKIGKSVNDDVSPVLKDLGEVVFPLLQEGLDYVTEAIKDVIAYFDSLAAKVNSFSLPDILTPGSPPPMAYAFMDIAKGASMAANSMSNLTSATDKYAQAGVAAIQRIASGAGLTGGSIQEAISEQIGFSARMFKEVGGSFDANKRLIAGSGILSNDERNAAETAIRETYSQLYESVLAGTAGTGEFIEAFKQNLRNQRSSLNQNELEKTIGFVSGQVGRVISTIRSQFGPLTLEMKSQALSMASSFNSLAGGFADLVSNQINSAKKAGDEILKLTESNKKLNLTLAGQQEKMTELQTDLANLTSATELDNNAIAAKQEAIAKLTEEMDKNRETVAKNQQAMADWRKGLMNTVSHSNEMDAQLAQIELLKEFLAGTEEAFRFSKIEEVGSFDFVWDRVRAQEELNLLLEKQAQIERDIAKQQEAEKQLSFLQMQLDLLKQGQALGVNVFKGLQFGLNASASDLLAATNRVTEAMIAEINRSLQISSPSRVMARIGGQVIAGMAQGIERGRSMLSDTVRNMPLLNGSVPQPVFSQQGGASSSNQNTYNYNFPMTVNTSATASGVIRQYEVKRSMYAN